MDGDRNSGNCTESILRLSGQKNGRKIRSRPVAWTPGIHFSGQSEAESFSVVACEEMKGGNYRGMLATSFV